ncbi:transcriptional regulator [Leptolyngbya sp. 'hensonii']|uniref:Crp/Fnr family transcriptional regulator n=1 Tax=Leptolyngbya sp. 'hensonii' TaxID=1922337 RepID=UPI00094F7C7E|nr:Crp/Fnr family transcriptional regulator [Leptolyngbya sp. 'hensonii']OLP18771.1 transcriptional regulator [Leptolyngbya sp. 'hensonii']
MTYSLFHSPSPESVSQSTDPRQFLEDLYQGRSLHHYSCGQTIPMTAQEVLIVSRGVVQLSTFYPTGDEALLGLAGPSMPFGLPLTVIHPYQAAALSDVDLMRVALAELEASSVLTQNVFGHLGRRLRQTEAFLALIGHRRVRDRLCHLLLLLTQEIGHPTAEGMRLNVRLTHQHLANAIGTTRVTVTRLLGQLKEEGWLSIDRSHHLIISETANF